MTDLELRALLACPTCRGSLRWQDTAGSCSACDGRFAIVDGIPVLLPTGRVVADDHLHEEHAAEHKSTQAAYYDAHAAAEFEIGRPNTGPRLYEWLMREKFRRSLAGIDGALARATALTVCGGSGMEAQFLAEAGYHVIASDISLGAAQRCRERARRFGFPILSIVADIDHLPFADRSISLVYVHDGLHHLEKPMAGLAEMARVAAAAVSITEPARAAVTALAVRLGLALEYEAAGNRVERLDHRAVRAVLQDLGFGPVRAHRYAMYYRHQPGRVVRLLSHPRVMPLATGAARATNLIAGRWGNKLTVSALR